MMEEGRKLEPGKDNLAYLEKRKIEDMNNQLKLENRVNREIFTKNNFESSQKQKLMVDSAPKRPENDSRLSNFVRGFRRESTDFFPSRAKRHSAVFAAEQQSSPAKNNAPQKMQRSSAIFQRNRTKDEPVLTGFMAKRDNTLGKTENYERPQDPVRLRQNAPNPDFHQLRREKTESVIFVSRNAPQFNQPLHQVKVDHRGANSLQVFWNHLNANLVCL